MGPLRLNLRRLCALLVGFVFFTAGVLKVMDPTGAGLIVTEYCKWQHLTFLIPASVQIGLALALIETIVGAALIAGIWRKVTAIVTSVMMAVYTILTLALVILNPDMDCGCFGEAMHLTHLQSFLKNIVIDILCAAAFIPLGNIGKPRKTKYVAFALVLGLLGWFTFKSYNSLPMNDFTAFAPGSELISAPGESINGADLDAYIFEKDGKRAALASESQTDSTWTLVDKKSYEDAVPAYSKEIPVLSITDADRNDCDSLAVDGKVMVVSVTEPDKVDNWSSVSDKLLNAEVAGYEPLLLVAGTPESLSEALGSHMSEWESEDLLERAYYSDYKTLITLNRSNTGMTYICDGVIICKWADKDTPDQAELQKVYDQNAVESMLRYSSRGRMTVQCMVIYSLAALMLL